MARVTVEDCLNEVENRFALVHAASKRAKMIFKGSYPLVECKNKEVVTALREIAEGKVTIIQPEVDAENPKTKKKK